MNGGELMSNDKKLDIKETVGILKQLDQTSLLIIDAGARMLLSKQIMEQEEDLKSRSPTT